eukprot:5852241-Prymnesium_polylepis.1
MKVDLPVPGGPCTSVAGPSSFVSARRWLGLRRRSWACASGCVSSSGCHGEAVFEPVYAASGAAAFAAAGRLAAAPVEAGRMPRPVARPGSSLPIERSVCTRWSAVLADASSTALTLPRGRLRAIRRILLSRSDSASKAMARDCSVWIGLQ